MTIVSQDKKSIVNYENIEVLGIGNPLENNEGKFAIIANAITDNQYILGEYETEKRAKEVLREIVQNYIYNEERRYCSSLLNEDQLLITKESMIYEMPKE